MTVCFSCHKKTHADTAELFASISNEDISEHKWSSSEDIDQVMVMDEETLEN